MKHKVSELTGALLDAAVAKAEGHKAQICGSDCLIDPPEEFHALIKFSPSRDAELGLSIIEREQITVVASTGHGGSEPLEWSADVGAFHHYIDEPLPLMGGRGPTPLIAAMRAYVSSKFGDEVEL